MSKVGLVLEGGGLRGVFTGGAVSCFIDKDINFDYVVGVSAGACNTFGYVGKQKEYIRNWVAVIGDSTFMHTGVNSLMNMVYNQSSGTVIILDNRTTGMTGHQDHPATGKTLAGEVVPAVDFKDLCNGIGITNVHVVNPYDLDELTKVIKEEVKKEELSVIIAKAPCALLKGQKHPYKVEPVPEKCVHCGACLRPGCPALTKKEDGSIVIDKTMCNGCGLCMSLCKLGALRKVEA